MKKLFVFSSIARPTWRYRVYQSDSDNPAHDWRRGHGISSYLSQYDTMGDREVQHSPDCNVQNDDMVDVVNSLAASIHRVNICVRDEEVCEMEVFRNFWRDRPSVGDDIIRFFRDLKFNEKKDTYFSVYDGCQKSHAESKRFDRRWVRLDRFDDDTSVYSRILSLIHTVDSLKPYGIIQWIATVLRIVEVTCTDTNWHWDAVRELKRGTVFKDVPNDDMHTFLDNFLMISRLQDSVWNMRAALGQSQRYANQLEHKRNKELEAATA